jgi:hypothetical protein
MLISHFIRVGLIITGNPINHGLHLLVEVARIRANRAPRDGTFQMLP